MSIQGTLIIHCIVISLAVKFIALVLWRRGLFTFMHTGPWLLLAVLIDFIYNPQAALLSDDLNTGALIYRSKMSHGGNKRNFEMFTPLEFIEAITQHIPKRLAQMVRYYGWYSNRMRGDRQRAELLQLTGQFRNSLRYIVDAGPREWPGLLANARIVIGQSFHATAFFVNFGVPFISLLRSQSDRDER